MTSKKAQSMGFIIVLIISVFAIVGVLIGTVNTWNSLACSMGVPLRSSFAPHVGNLNAKTLLIESNISDIDFESCYDDCILTVYGPSYTFFSPLCQRQCFQICPRMDGSCKSWVINMTYNTPEDKSGQVQIAFYTKPNLGDYEYTVYGDSRLMSYDSPVVDISGGQTRTYSISKPYLNTGEEVGPGAPWYYRCDAGSFFRIKAEADGKESVIEDENAQAFCVIPKINVSTNLSGSNLLFNLNTDISSTCSYSFTGANPIVPVIANLELVANTDGTNHNITKNNTVGYHYFICKDMLYGTAAQVWWYYWP